MSTAISKDGTTIAYDKTGHGPCIIVVNGALAHRKLYGENDLADALAQTFTAIFFDRRGRGGSADTKPYTVEKEIEDIEAIVDEAGGRAYLYGSSSGAALALRAVAKLGPGKTIKLALYEPPYGSCDARFAEEKRKVNELIATGKPGDAVPVFMESRGTPPAAMEDMKNHLNGRKWNKQATHSNMILKFCEMHNSHRHHKKDRHATLVMNGGKSFDLMHVTADMLGGNYPRCIAQNA